VALGTETGVGITTWEWEEMGMKSPFLFPTDLRW